MKIFGIGYPKTGTTTLNEVLKELGYKPIHNNTLFEGKDTLDVLNNELSDYNAFSDSPIFKEYKLLDKEFPNSKFILTYRNSEKWWQSWSKHHFLKEVEYKKGNRLSLYSLSKKKEWIRKYEAQKKEAQKYFSERRSDLLELDLTTDSDPLFKLTNFLDCKIKKGKVPKYNSLQSVKNTKLKALKIENSNYHQLKYFFSDKMFKNILGNLEKKGSLIVVVNKNKFKSPSLYVEQTNAISNILLIENDEIKSVSSDNKKEILKNPPMSTQYIIVELVNDYDGDVGLVECQVVFEEIINLKI